MLHTLLVVYCITFMASDARLSEILRHTVDYNRFMLEDADGCVITVSDTMPDGLQLKVIPCTPSVTSVLSVRECSQPIVLRTLENRHFCRNITITPAGRS